MGYFGTYYMPYNKENRFRLTLLGWTAQRSVCIVMEEEVLKKGPQAKGLGRKGLSTKIHVSLSPGCLKSACLSEGQRVDMKVFTTLWKKGDWKDIEYVIADKGYDYYEVRHTIQQANKIPVIPRRKGAICPGVQDKQRYKTRSAIERFFGHVKENKRMALQFDKLDSIFFSFFALAVLKVLKLLC